MLTPLSNHFSFGSLSLKDLIEARNLFHVHLINKANVVATAIGKYLVRSEDLDEGDKILPDEKRLPPAQRHPRTLFNAKVVGESWPCILVFVDEWVSEDRLSQHFAEDLTQVIPKNIYLPDGRIVPICVVKVTKSREADAAIEADKLMFPVNFIGGGFPLKIFSQGVERIASVGCIVHDGSKYYALTNKHVVGAPGTVIYTELKGSLVPIGKSAVKQLETLTFTNTYKDWPGENLILNADVGLIEIDNLNQWKTDILGIGTLGPVADLNVHNMSLNLVGTSLSAYGAVSGQLAGEIKALFYRYKSVGGYEYIADFMIAPKNPDGRDGLSPATRQGDSGTLWVIDEVKYNADRTEKNLPLALQWGEQRFISGAGIETSNFSLATGLSNICRILEVDIVRDWNLDQDYSWGKTGHFKTAAFSCELVSDSKLSKLLMANLPNIGYSDTSFLDKKVMSGKFTETFVPLADVADIYWRSKRPNDKNNHFADMDEAHPDVHGGKSLLELCKKPSNVTVDFWLEFYAALDAADPHLSAGGRLQKRLGALPFRVGQMYQQMIASLRAGKVDEFICAGGTMAHYVGDASQPLHISHLHHGEEEGEGDVHSDYENKMIDTNMNDFLQKVNAQKSEVKAADLIGETGLDAARRIVALMTWSYKNLSPQKVLDVWRDSAGNGKLKAMWAELGDPTAENIAEGARVMAILWQSAWKWGNGQGVPESALHAVSKTALMKLYKNKNFVPSFYLSNPSFKEVFEREAANA